MMSSFPQIHGAHIASTRRRFLAATGSAATFAARPVFAQQKPVTPDEAIKRLMDGNGRFVGGRILSFNEDLTILKDHTVAKQEPFAAVLSCIDSRVPVEIVFDQSIGHIVVSRVAGNICTPEVIASLEYGAYKLGAAAIMVLGHADCGAVQATIAAAAVPGQISALYAPLRQAVERAGPDPDNVARENAKIQANLLRTASPLIADLVKKEKLKVVPAFFALDTGIVTLL
jgi:carbonic anhydrase